MQTHWWSIAHCDYPEGYFLYGFPSITLGQYIYNFFSLRLNPQNFPVSPQWEKDETEIGYQAAVAQLFPFGRFLDQSPEFGHPERCLLSPC